MYLLRPRFQYTLHRSDMDSSRIQLHLPHKATLWNRRRKCKWNWPLAWWGHGNTFLHSYNGSLRIDRSVHHRSPLHNAEYMHIHRCPCLAHKSHHFDMGFADRHRRIHKNPRRNLSGTHTYTPFHCECTGLCSDSHVENTHCKPHNSPLRRNHDRRTYRQDYQQSVCMCRYSDTAPGYTSAYPRCSSFPRILVHNCMCSLTGKHARSPLCLTQRTVGCHRHWSRCRTILLSGQRGRDTCMPCGHLGRWHCWHKDFLQKIPVEKKIRTKISETSLILFSELNFIIEDVWLHKWG